MSSNHHFEINLDWNINNPSVSENGRIYSKSHTIKIDNKQDLQISAAKTFKGDPSLYNPEDLLLSSLTSCHMMSYLYCCAQHKIEVISFQDNAEAILEVNDDGSGKIVKVSLHPIVTITEESNIELAKSLHKNANQLCFIANSCNFLIEHYPIIKISE